MRYLNETILAEIVRYLRSSNPSEPPIPWITRRFMISRQQATRYLKFLCERDIIRLRGVGRGARYFYLGTVSQVVSTSINCQSESPLKSSIDKIFNSMSNSEIESNRGQLSQGLLIFLFNFARLPGLSSFQISSFMENTTFKTELTNCENFLKSIGSLYKRSTFQEIIFQLLRDPFGLISNAAVEFDYFSICAANQEFSFSIRTRDWSLKSIGSGCGTRILLEKDLVPNFELARRTRQFDHIPIVVPRLYFGSLKPEQLTSSDALNLLECMKLEEPVILDFRRMGCPSVDFLSIFRPALHDMIARYSISIRNVDDTLGSALGL